MKARFVANFIAIAFIIANIYFNNYIEVNCSSFSYNINEKYQCKTMKEFFF
jgi:hypothetical protein